MKNNFCVENLGITNENYKSDEFYINAVVESKILNSDLNNILEALKDVVKSKYMLFNGIYFNKNGYWFEENNESRYNISVKEVSSYNSILKYSNTQKNYVSQNFTYEFVVFICKENKKRYLYASFFHAVIDGVGGFLLLEEAMNYIGGKIKTLPYDKSTGKMEDLSSRKRETRPQLLDGNKDKVKHKATTYEYTLDKEKYKMFLAIMKNYGLSCLELSILMLIRLSYLFPNIDLKTIDCIFNLRNKKDMNTLGMYANTLPLEFKFDKNLIFKDMISEIRSKIFKTLKNRRNIFYKYGNSRSNCLLSMVYNHTDDKEYIVNWIDSDTIFYDYFITIMQGKELTFKIQIDNKIQFNLISFEKGINEIIEYMYENKNINKFSNINPILTKSFVKTNSFSSTFEEKLNNSINTDKSIVLDGKQKFTSKEIRYFILLNAEKMLKISNNSVICIKGGTAEEEILIALTALYIGKSYSFISDKAPLDYVNYLLRSIDGILVSPSDFSYDFSDLSFDKSIQFKKIPRIICYFMTSGTTGFPKIIPDKKESINSFISLNTSEFTRANSVNLLTTDLSFDLSLHSLFNTLCNGGTLVITDLKLIYKNNYIENLISNKKVTHVLATPSFLSLINYSKIPINTIFGAVGEILPSYLAKKIIKKFVLYNMYGPTEATCFVTECKITEENVDNIPIGKTIKNANVNVIDSFGLFIPDGYEGELVISGPAVFDGYLNSKGNEFLSIQGGTNFYKTGDIGYIKDGIFFFSKRKDNQVKISGYRIELGKIEEVVSKILSGSAFYLKIINKAIVLFHTSGEEDKNIRLELKNYLPEYMIPSRIIKLNKIPLNKNYKVDERKLLLLDKESRMLDIPQKKGINQEVANILLNKGVDLNNLTNVTDSGLSSMQLFALQKELFSRGYNLTLEELFSASILDLLELKKEKNENRIKYDYGFSEYYEPSNIQKKFIVNYFKNNQSTIDNIGAVIKYSKYSDALAEAKVLQNKIIKNLSLHYVVALRNGKIVMEIKKDFSVPILEISDSISNIKNHITHFDLFKDSLCSIKLLHSSNENALLVEFHHIIIDGISILELLNDDQYKVIPYKNYRALLNDYNKLEDTSFLENEVQPYFDKNDYKKKLKTVSSNLKIDENKVDLISRLLKISHETIFAVAYAKALHLKNLILCTPVNLRKRPEDNFIIGPLINLIGFKVENTGSTIKDMQRTNVSLLKSLKHPFADLESIATPEIFMTHLVTIFNSYDSSSKGNIDYKISNSLYDEKFKINTYIYEENNFYDMYCYSKYLSTQEIDNITMEIKKTIDHIYDTLEREK